MLSAQKFKVTIKNFQSLNFDLTAGYLNLVVNLITLMILLSRVEDRKAVLGNLFSKIEYIFLPDWEESANFGGKLLV